MDNYDVVIEKTVRDLFKSSKLNQIKKLKILKDTEINKKDEDLRSLILEKYPILIQSISSLEKISLNVSELHSIRKNLGINVNKIQNNFELNNFYKFSIADKLYEEPDEKLTGEDECIKEEIEKCQILLNEKEFDSLLISMINLKKKLEKYSRNNSHNDNKMNYLYLIEDYEFVLVDYMETLMKNFIQNNFYSPYDKKVMKSNANTCQWNLTKFFLHIFGVFHLVYDKEKLNFSHLYLKLKKEKNIQEIYENIFITSKEKFMTASLTTSDIPNKTLIGSVILTLECIIKLQLLKLSKFIHSKSENSKNKQKNNFSEILINTYIVTILIDSIKSLNKKNEDDSSSESNSDLDSDENSSDYEIFESNDEFNLKKILKEISLIFSIPNDLINMNLFISNEQTEDNYKNSIRNFLILIKDQINLKKNALIGGHNFEENLLGNDDVILKQLINPSVSLILSQNPNQKNGKLDEDRDLVKYMCKNMFAKPKLALINKIIIEIKPDLVKDSLNNVSDPFLLFNFLFLETLSERIQFIISKEFEKMTSENLGKINKHTNIDIKTNFQNELKIEKIFKEIADLEISNADLKHTNILLNSTIRNILNTLMKNFLEDYMIKINTLCISNTQDMNFLIKTFSNKTFKNYLQKLEFFECLESIRVIGGEFYKNQIEEVKSYMDTFKNLILLENYLDEDCYNECDMFSNCLLNLTNSLNKNFNHDEMDFIDDKTEKIEENTKASLRKFQILEIIIKCYTEILEEFDASSLSKRIKNDLYTLVETFKKFKLSYGFQTYDESSGSGRMINVFEKKYLQIHTEDNVNENIKNTLDNKGEEHVSFKEFQNFFLLIDNSEVNHNERHENSLRLVATSNLKKKVFNVDFLLSNKIPAIDLTPQLNPFLIRKTHKNNQQQVKKSLNNASTNSISKLLVLSIDSNYVSLKSPSQPSLIKTPPIVHKPASKPHVQKIKSNGEKKNEKHVPNDNSSSTRDSNANKGYLGYFGGMLKDLSNLTGIKTNSSTDVQQNLK